MRQDAIKRKYEAKCENDGKLFTSLCVQMFACTLCAREVKHIDRFRERIRAQPIAGQAPKGAYPIGGRAPPGHASGAHRAYRADCPDHRTAGPCGGQSPRQDLFIGSPQRIPGGSVRKALAPRTLRRARGKRKQERGLVGGSPVVHWHFAGRERGMGDPVKPRDFLFQPKCMYCLRNSLAVRFFGGIRISGLAGLDLFRRFPRMPLSPWMNFCFQS